MMAPSSAAQRYDMLGGTQVSASAKRDQGLSAVSNGRALVAMHLDTD